MAPSPMPASAKSRTLIERVRARRLSLHEIVSVSVKKQGLDAPVALHQDEHKLYAFSFSENLLAGF